MSPESLMVGSRGFTLSFFTRWRLTSFIGSTVYTAPQIVGAFNHRPVDEKRIAAVRDVGLRYPAGLMASHTRRYDF